MRPFSGFALEPRLHPGVDGAPSKMFIAITEEEHMLIKYFRRSSDRHQELQRTLRRIEDRLDLIFKTEHRIMSVEQDILDELTSIGTEADTIASGIATLEAQLASGNQAAIDQAFANVKTAVDALKGHVDTAAAALPPAAPPADSSAPTS